MNRKPVELYVFQFCLILVCTDTLIPVALSLWAAQQVLLS